MPVKITNISANELLQKMMTTGSEITVSKEIAARVREAAEKWIHNLDAQSDATQKSGISLRMKENSNNCVTVSIDNGESHPKEKSLQNYYMPAFAAKVRCLLQDAIAKKHSANILLTGLAGTGKTEFVYEIAKESGFDTVYQVEGSEGLTASDFYGSLSVDIDRESSQNYTKFDKGPLYKAFIHGTEVDALGNQVLYDDNGNVTTDGSGKPKVIGKPAVFFLDEFAAMLPEVFLGVFNRALEIPRNEGESRSIEIPMDNGRVVKSHPGMVVFLAGNTVGCGNSGKYQMSYTAQSNRMDESTLNRITATFHFRYNRDAEQKIAISLLNDELDADLLLKLRDEMRKLYVNEQVERVFSTRDVRQVCELAKSYKTGGISDYLVEALRDNIFNQLPETDKPAWNQQINAIFNRDFMLEDAANAGGYDVI